MDPMKELLLFLGKLVALFVTASGWVVLFGIGWTYFTYVKPFYDEAGVMRQQFEQAVVAGDTVPALEKRFAPPPPAAGHPPLAAPEIERIPPEKGGGIPRYVMRWQRTAGPLGVFGIVFHFSAIAPNPSMNNGQPYGQQ